MDNYKGFISKNNKINESKIAETIQEYIEDWYSSDNKDTSIDAIHGLTNANIEDIKHILENNDKLDVLEIIMGL